MKRLFSLASVLIVVAVVLITKANGQIALKDTTYKFGNFLISTRGAMKIDFMLKNRQFVNTQNRDTLYEDKKYLILGKARDLNGVYRKYKVPYKYSDYKVSVYTGELAAPDFKTDPSALLFRTQIRTQCKENGINFAGHFTLVKWGCGSPCLTVAIVDRITGRIQYSKIDKQNEFIYYTIACKPNSTMVIMNDWMLEEFKGYVCCSKYWKLKVAKWSDKKFQLLAVQD